MQFRGCRGSGSSDGGSEGAVEAVRAQPRGCGGLQRHKQEPQTFQGRRRRLQGRTGKSGGTSGDYRGAVRALGHRLGL